MSCQDDVKVIGRVIVLVVLGTSQVFMVVHDPEVCSLNGVVGVEGVGNPVFVVVISTSSCLHFISYAVALASFCTIGRDGRRLSSCIVSWVWSGVSLDVDNIDSVINSIASNIGRSVCWSISRRVGWSISCSVSSGVDRFRYFVFVSSLFSHRVEGTLAMTSLARTLRSASGVGTCCGSAVSRTSFFDLSSGNADVGLETSDHWRIFKVI
jgi:hypothetical protein